MSISEAKGTIPRKIGLLALVGAALVLSQGLAPTIGGAGAQEAEVDADIAGAPQILERFVGLSDPVSWTTDPVTGATYRRATANEMAANGWRPGAYLVDATGLDALIGGAPAGTLVVPVDDGDARRFDVALVSATVGPMLAVTELGGREESFVPTVRVYRSALPDLAALASMPGQEIAFAEVTTTDHGGLYAQAVVAGVRADILGPEAGWVLDDVSAPEGDKPTRVGLVQLVPQPQPSHTHCNFTGIAIIDNLLHTLCILVGIRPQCSDGIDNDGDRWVDWPSDPGCSNADDNSEFDSRTLYNFGLFGEIKWCTRNIANWAALISNVWAEINNGFDGNGGVKADPVPIFGHCWTATSQANADACANSGGCTHGDGHNYPYNSCGTSSTCYLDRVWSDVAHARNHFSFAQLKFAQAQHDGSMDGSSTCGVAYFPSSGASVALGRPYTDAGCRDYVSTHEAGHNFAGNHYNGVENGCGTALAQSFAVSCRWNYFADTNRVEINNCVRTNPSCPRSGTG